MKDGYSYISFPTLPQVTATNENYFSAMNRGGTFLSFFKISPQRSPLCDTLTLNSFIFLLKSGPLLDSRTL